VFGPTDGLVTDPMSPIGGQSMHSLDNHFPDPANKGLFIAKVQELLAKEAGNDFIFSQYALSGLIEGEDRPYPKEKTVTIVPMTGQSIVGGNTLFMAAAPNKYGELVPVPNKVTGAPIIIPISIANQEIQARAERLEEEEILANQASEAAIAKRMREMQAGELERPDFPSEDAS